MIEQWKTYLGVRVVYFAAFLTLLVLFCFSLSVIRLCYTGELFFLFLIWNLFLALLPWVGIETACWLKRQKAPSVLVGLFLGLTLLFLPNAPYIITDLGHLHWSSLSQTLWLDNLLIFAYASTGLVGFYATLLVLEQLLEQYMGRAGASIAIVVVVFLNGFGIYLGRFLRFNSWDLWANPWSLVEVIGERFLYPLAHLRTWGVTLGYGSLFLLGFYGIKLFKYTLTQQFAANQQDLLPNHDAL